MKPTGLPPTEYRKFTLGNGMTLVVERHLAMRSCSIGVWVRTGSVCETESQNGISHFIEHMTFKGTQKRTPLQIATVLECLGGELNAYTDREHTCYHATVLTEHVDVALDVLSDLVFHATIPGDQLERERRVLLQELQMVRESPEDSIGDLFFSEIWKDHSLGRPVIGTRENIKKFSRAQLVSYFRKHYVPKNMVIAVAGNVDFEKLRASCEKFFGEPGVAAPKAITKKAPKYHRSHKWISKNTDQLHLLIGFDGYGFRDSYRFDALIMSFFLGGGMSSRLFQEVREQAGLAYSVECDCIPYALAGAFSVYLALAPKSLGTCLEIIGREITKLKEKPLNESDLELVKGQLRGTILLNSDQMEVRQESLGRNELVFGRYVSVEEVIEEIERVTPERIHALAGKLFDEKKESILVLSRTRPKAGSLSIF